MTGKPMKMVDGKVMECTDEEIAQMEEQAKQPHPQMPQSPPPPETE